MSKKRLSSEMKVALVEQYKRGEGSIAALAEAAGTSPTAFRVWLRNYDGCGPEAFFDRHHQRYSASF